MTEHATRLIDNKTLSPLGLASLANNLENVSLPRRIASKTPKIDIIKSLIAIFGAFIAVLVAPVRDMEIPNKNAKRPKKGRHEQKEM